MILCRVIGSVVKAAPRSTSTAEETPLVIVQPVDAGGQRLGGEMVAEARVRTSVGDLVLVDPERRRQDAAGQAATSGITAVAVAVVVGLNVRQ